MGQATQFISKMLLALFPDAKTAWSDRKTDGDLDVDLTFVDSDAAEDDQDDHDTSDGDGDADLPEAEVNVCKEPKEEATIRNSSTDTPSALLAEKKDKFYQVVNTGCQGLLFIRFRNSVDELEFITKVHSHLLSLSSEAQTKIFKSIGFTCRWLPIHATTPATLPDIINMIRPMIAKHEALQQPSGWDGVSNPGPTMAVVVDHIRNCTTIEKKELVNEVAKEIPLWCKVDLTKPDLSIFVSVFKHAAGVAILPKYHQLKKYNLQSIRQTSASQ
ncbi:hypothetical protein SmJEL517_g02983 [Synchytrium microbalum]|uniref:THUMP domain-containing protein n=1 Tax=Synchytrium microbalum TaxID=1806994 RepID=A0A507C9U8_9FUNG|nr:uncharacterized protein SmJEL517_g02983 [Synchytrium microbalum]TPX34323.1 hypothetical protein SmJEL517_g02983 [Synchytrium microbalum]